MVNRLIIKLSVAIVILFALAGFAVRASLKLDKPVFFKTYAECYVNINVGMQQSPDFNSIKYITNVGDSRSVVGISFPAAPQLKILATEVPQTTGFVIENSGQKQAPGKNYGCYCVRTVYISFQNSSSDTDLEQLQIKDAMITFNTGETMKVDLGEILFYHEYGSSPSALDSMHSSSSSGGTYEDLYNVNSNITVDSLELKLSDSMKKLVDIQIDKQPYDAIAGYELKGGDTLDIKAKFPVPQDILKQYSTYVTSPKLHYHNEKGTLCFKRTLGIHYEPADYTFGGIKNYLKARGVQ